MALRAVSDHAIASVIHVQILRDDSDHEPSKAFTAQINAPGFSKSLPLNNQSSVDFPIATGVLQGKIHVEVDDFNVLPHGATTNNATAITCNVVFKLINIVRLTLGSIPVTAALR
jgi:hypothetical protein